MGISIPLRQCFPNGVLRYGGVVSPGMPEDFVTIILQYTDLQKVFNEFRNLIYFIGMYSYPN